MQKMMKCDMVKLRLELTQHSSLRSISAVILWFGTHKTQPLTSWKSPPRGTLRLLAIIDPVQFCFMESFRGWIIYICVINTVCNRGCSPTSWTKKFPFLRSCLTPLHIHRKKKTMMSATRAEVMTCRFRWAVCTHGWKQNCHWIAYWFMKISLTSRSLSFGSTIQLGSLCWLRLD